MFAVIRTGGKQYRVVPGQVIEIEKVAGAPGDIIELGEVLLVGGNGSLQTGKPLLAGATVAAEVLAQKRAPKIIVFKKKRRSTYRRKRGHVQALTAVRITEILTDGKKPSKKAAPKPETKKVEAKPAAKAGKPAKKAEARPQKKAEAKAAAKKSETKAKTAANKPASRAAKPKTKK